MVPGLHWDFDQEEIVSVGDPFGWLWIDDTKSSKTLKGWGTKFFWAQCLMGDAADNIKGLPAVTQKTLGKLNIASAAYVKAANKLNAAKNLHKKDFDRLFDSYNLEAAKTKPVGCVLAHKMLEPAQNDRMCYNIVRASFLDLAETEFRFVDHKSQEECTPTMALFGDMLTLWMRRVKDPMDVLHWLKEERVL